MRSCGSPGSNRASSVAASRKSKGVPSTACTWPSGISSSDTGSSPSTGTWSHCAEAGTAVRLASTFRYATGVAPLDAYQVEHGRVGTPSGVIEDLTAALTSAIEELTRPVDAIKHQAKTVTVE